MAYIPIDEHSDSEISLGDNSEQQHRDDTTSVPTAFTTEDEVPISGMEYMTGYIHCPQRLMQIIGFFIIMPMFIFTVFILYLAFSNISKVSAFIYQYLNE